MASTMPTSAREVPSATTDAGTDTGTVPPAVPVLEIDNLSISFFTRTGEIPAVMDFSTRVMAGESMGLVGESGCGKSTVALGVMRDLGANGRIVAGSVRFKGTDLGTLDERALGRIRGKDIAMVYQEPMASLNPAMKVGHQLAEVPILHEGISSRDADRRALTMIDAVRLPDARRVMDSYPHQLSGGQQQRIVIAMALLSSPSLLLLDEPTTALDVTVEAGIVQLVKNLGAEFDTSMLFVSHNLGLILETCDRVTVMYSGEAVETGGIHDVFGGMRHPYTRALFRSIPLPGTDKRSRPLVAIPGQLPLPHERPRGCNFGPRCDHFVAGTCDVDVIPMVAVPDAAGDARSGAMAGAIDSSADSARDVPDRARGEPPRRSPHASRCVRIGAIDWSAAVADGIATDAVEPGGVVLDVKGLKKYYEISGKGIGGGSARTVKANESLSFQAREAETVAIVGESGCGKSTLAKVLLGLETATAGEIVLGERRIESTEVQARDTATVASIQMVFQNPFDTLNPSATIGNQIVRTLERFGVGTGLRQRENLMLELLDLVKLPRAFATRKPRQLSGGQKQRIGVARAFAGRPKVVVADEPVSALDVSVQAAVTGLLNDIQRESRTTMLFISHDLSVVRYIADRVIVMYLGHIVEQGTTDEIFAPPYHPYTEALLSAIPIADPRVRKRHIVLDGDVPSAVNPPPGCPFQTRCAYKGEVADNRCETELPLDAIFGDGHRVKCHLPRERLAEMAKVIEA